MKKSNLLVYLTIGALSAYATYTAEIPPNATLGEIISGEAKVEKESQYSTYIKEPIRYHERVYKEELDNVITQIHNNGGAVFILNSNSGGELIHMGRHLGEPKDKYTIQEDFLGGISLATDNFPFNKKAITNLWDEAAKATEEKDTVIQLTPTDKGHNEHKLSSSKKLNKPKVELNLNAIKPNTRYLVSYIIDNKEEKLLGIYAEEMGVDTDLALLRNSIIINLGYSYDPIYLTSEVNLID